MSQNKENFSSMSFSQHLKELRSRLMNYLIFYIIGFIFCWYFRSYIIDWISRPITPYLKHSSGQLIFTAPMDEFLSLIKISLFGSAVLNFPIFMFHLWKFCASGLYHSEKKALITLNVVGVFLFTSGVLFVYYVVYPFSFKFLMEMGSLVPLISIKEYLSFFILTTFVFGFLFELPLVILGLTWLQILNIDQLKKGRKYALVLLAILAALVTPPDVISMLFLLAPLYLLYEIGLFVSSIFGVQRNGDHKLEGKE